MNYLTEHFSVDELTASDVATRLGLDNVPGYHELGNLYLLASRLEQIRAILGFPVLVSSGYRSPKVNAAVKGSPSSAHVQGLAADFRCPSFGSPRQVALELKKHVDLLDYDQLIFEGTWVHAGFKDPSTKARREELTANFAGGKASYTKGIA